MMIRITIVLLVLLLLSGGFGYYSFKKWREELNERQSVQILFGKKVAEVEIYRNKAGQEVTRNEALSMENKTVKELIANGNLSWLKEFDGLKRSMRNLEFGYQIVARDVDSFKVSLKDTTRYVISHSGDTIFFKAMKFKYEDKFTLILAKQITQDSVSVDYQVRVPLNGAMYWKRKWFLGKKKYYSEITSDNPHVVIPELVNIKVGRK